ncbi:Com family DNA-binding transcriptional regulator [Moraxella sp. ZY210820]|uniref:Com family DNA-binding transcriptional regulator n=1 Tax=unclassified Moraxella TaxID=2685852 RepID=UPI00351E1D45
MKEFRCTCGRLLAKVENRAVKVQIKCPRCSVVNHWNVLNVGSDSHELPLQENKHGDESQNGRKSSPI